MINQNHSKRKLTLIVSHELDINQGQFCENFENTSEIKSLIVRGPMRSHIQIKMQSYPQSAAGSPCKCLKRRVSYCRTEQQYSMNEQLPTAGSSALLCGSQPKQQQSISQQQQSEYIAGTVVVVMSTIRSDDECQSVVKNI